MRICKTKGSALAVVLLVMFVLAIIGSTLLNVSLAETRQVSAHVNNIKNYYAARAGADAVASFLIKNKNYLGQFIEKTKHGPLTGELDSHDFQIYVYGTEHEFLIESTSVNPSVSNSSRVLLTMSEINLLDHAVFARDILDTGNNLTIKGNIGTNNKSVIFGHNLVQGNITLGPDASAADIDAAKAMVASGYMVTKLSVPIEYPVIKPSDFSVYLPNGTPGINTNNYTLIDGKLMATLDNITISGSGNNFIASGGGQVHLYIPGEIKVSGNAAIGTDANTKLFLYYDKSDTIVFNGTPDSNVTIYAPTATIKFNGGGSNENIIGSFICDVFQGPDSNCTLTMGNGSMQDLMVEGVAGYYRSAWSK